MIIVTLQFYLLQFKKAQLKYSCGKKKGSYTDILKLIQANEVQPSYNSANPVELFCIRCQFILEKAEN